MLRLPRPRRALGGLLLAVLGTIAVWSCSRDSPTIANDDDGGITNADTSSLTIAQLTFTAYNEDGDVHTGLTLQWKLRFASTTGRDCRIRSYTLRDQHGTDVFTRLEPNPGYISDGNELTDKVTWIPIEGATSAGNYVFSVAYETGRLYLDTGDHRRWVGPSSDGTVTESFEAVPINQP